MPQLAVANEKKPATSVRDLMTRNVATCGPHASLVDAARLMWSRDCGFLPVTDDSGNLHGVVTDRDACMAAYTQGRPLSQILVKTAMTTDVATVDEDDPLERAHQLMREHRIRRLPVLDRTRRVVGVVSLNDVALHAMANGAEGRDVAETLAEVSRHRTPIAL